MEVRLLGPVEVVAEDGPVPLGGPRQRAVVAMLALATPAVVSTDRVVDGLWGEDPPDRPVPTLQVFVSKLRKALTAQGGAAFLESRPPGYRLVVDPLDTDVGRFADLTARARQAPDAGAALELLDEALALWRGAALADVREMPFADAEVVRLEELRLQAEEARVDLALRLGRHGELVATLEELVHQHPTRERFWGQLMTALYRGDRQADALAAYGRARDGLADELGIDPGEALRQLEVAVLRHDPSLDAPAADAVLIDPRSAPVPAPRAAARVPVPLDETIGRTEIVAGVVARIAGGTRVLSLTGVGGAGKSRVAMEAARVARDGDDLDDVVWLSVTEATDAHQLALELALTLGAPPREDPLDALHELDPGRRVLVVVDNLESLAEGATLVRDLAETSPALRVLATSRVALRIPGEHEERVPPLPVPTADAPPAEVAASPAVRLFMARAVAARPGFTLAGHEHDVAALARFLDGVPLALELAAARLRLMAPDRLLAALTSSLQLLTTGSSAVPERQRALTTTIQWSLERLDDADRLVCDRLALFERGFTVEALEAVCDDVPDVLESLAAIVDARLVRPVESRVEVRFVVLGTVRAYLRQRSHERPDLELRRDRLAVHLRERLAADDLDGPDGLLTLARYDDDAADLDAALDRAIELGDAAGAAATALASTEFWVASGRLVDGRRRVERVRALPGHDPVTAARLAAASTTLAYQLTDWALAAATGREALALAEAAGDAEAAARARCYLAGALAVSGDPAAGADLATAALAAAEDLGLATLQAVSLSMLAISRAIAGDLDGEREAYQRRLDVVRTRGDVARTADTLNTLAEIALDDADAGTAEAYAGESRRLTDGRLPLEERDALITLARAAAVREDCGGCAVHLADALVLADRTGQTLALAQCLRVGAALGVLAGDPATSVRLVAAAHVLSPSPSGTEEPVERDLAGWLERAREATGPEVAAREWTLGSALPTASVRALLDALVERVREPVSDRPSGS